MRNLLSPLLFATFVLTACATAQQSRPEDPMRVQSAPQDVAEIKRTRQAYVSACLAGDWDEATKQWTEDGVRMVNNGHTEHGHAVLRKHFDAIEKILKWDEIWDEVQVSGSVAYARTHGTITAKLKASPELFSYAAKSLTIFRKQQDGRWLIAVDSYNPDPPAVR